MQSNQLYIAVLIVFRHFKRAFLSGNLFYKVVKYQRRINSKINSLSYIDL